MATSRKTHILSSLALLPAAFFCAASGLGLAAFSAAAKSGSPSSSPSAVHAPSAAHQNDPHYTAAKMGGEKINQKNFAAPIITASAAPIGALAASLTPTDQAATGDTAPASPHAKQAGADTLAKTALTKTPPASSNTPIVVEFFLSQACPACPSAAKDAKMLAGRDDLITLSWHVDYWDTLKDPKKGTWRDPYAKADYSDRQTQYNDNIRGRPRNFTPQAVINGVTSVVAKNMGAVDDALKQASPLKDGATMIDIGQSDDMLTITITPNEDNLDTKLVYFQRSTKTSISAGHNHGIEFVNANVVFEVETLALNGAEPLMRPAPETGMGCAILVQETGQGPVRAAKYCP